MCPPKLSGHEAPTAPTLGQYDFTGCLPFILAGAFLFGAVVLVSESGEPSPIGPRGAGYVLWLTSMFFALLGSAWGALAPSEHR